ncbi:MAG: hypothetical protein PHW50_02395 [Patescibacteria group bacterium]|nr:hypothetical protein [Patescibacteria group bacterium]
MKSNALSQLAFWLSLIAIILAFAGALGKDLWLASTQWVLIAAVLAIWSISFKD